MCLCIDCAHSTVLKAEDTMKSLWHFCSAVHARPQKFAPFSKALNFFGCKTSCPWRSSQACTDTSIVNALTFSRLLSQDECAVRKMAVSCQHRWDGLPSAACMKNKCALPLLRATPGAPEISSAAPTILFA